MSETRGQLDRERRGPGAGHTHGGDAHARGADGEGPDGLDPARAAGEEDGLVAGARPACLAPGWGFVAPFLAAV